ncbi:MAG: glycosyltransferase family 39 protein [Flavobacteriales bacterium]|nr:glycosyltransferase family 39 protein [Flavobacteriales bacterium]
MLLALVVLALAFHSLNLQNASYELDEAVHIWHAQKSYAQVVEQASNDPNPPIYNLIISTWVKVFGVSEFSTRFFSVLMGALGVAVMFLLGSRNFGLSVGIMAALFYCFSPIQFRFTHLARPYSMLMVSVMLSYGLLLEILKSPTKWRLFWYYFFTTLMIYVHPTSVFNLVAQGFIVIYNRHTDFREMVKLFLPMFAAAATFGIWVLSIPYFERDDAMWFGPPDWQAIYYVIKVFFGSTELVLAQILLLIILVIVAIRKRPIQFNKDLVFVLLWGVVPFVASIAFSHVIKPIFQDKYILSVQPAVMLLLALSIDRLGHRAMRSVALASVVLLFALQIDITPNAEDDWKRAVEYVNPLHTENSMILIDPWYEFRTFAFYFNRHGFEVPDSTQWYINSKRVFTSWNDVYDTINKIPRTDVVHLMLSHQGYVNPEVPTDVIESVATLIGQKEFPGVTVRSYSFTAKLDTVLSVRKDFAEMTDGVSIITSDDEFSETIAVPLSSMSPGRILNVTVSVDVRAKSDLSGVSLVLSVEKDGESSFYKTIDLARLDIPIGETRSISERTAVMEFQTHQIIKVYLWNSKGKTFEIDNLAVTVEN